ncbi:transferase family protein [Medicago truncatula]|uniref:Transferase family protein n=1 Tax=Medicago truncatula TaxID=3880 RepID=G7KUL0_MEDTR|nr:transferase family protein [Medicago truncatula]
MEMELVSRETIKPSSPTPHHLRIYPLSFLDNSDQNSKISQLRKSLSQILSKYYIFAGRLKDKITIECNDQGVTFIVTKIKNKLSDILQNPSEETLNSLFPDNFMYSPTRVLVVTAWMHKHAVSAIGLNFRTTSFAMIVDLRKRMFPPLSEKCLGNMSVIADKEEMDLKDLVYKLLILILRKKNVIGFSSWCNFPIYEADFGWGKPTWLTTAVVLRIITLLSFSFVLNFNLLIFINSFTLITFFLFNINIKIS